MNIEELRGRLDTEIVAERNQITPDSSPIALYHLGRLHAFEEVKELVTADHPQGRAE